MTEAMIKADYVSKDYMKVSGAVRFVFEVAHENAEEAERIMGLPIKGGNKWCAIALLKQSEEQP